MTVNDPQQDAPAPARTGIWYNKRELSRVEVPVPHTLSSHNDGWRIDFGGPGRIRIVAANGPNQKIDVVEGDSLLSSGEDFYLSVSTEPAEDPKDEHSKAKQQGREQGAGGGASGGSKGVG